MKYLIALNSVLSFTSIQAQNAQTDSISAEKLSSSDSLKLEYQKSIQIINDQEAKAIYPHDSICKSIEIQLNEDSEKKLLGKLSRKKRGELQRKLQTEKATINIQSGAYEISRKEKEEEFEEKFNKQN
ncbi:hypothetical protein [Mangrovibacterium lignilyticum]|uniref:hypothetical protein n=1 Tax=Mangrovibacterium lignilyticum TaxID=2668052 RepID=UPI0013D56D22|nr:hypothetical protein [Mangrovibacterium lignilyticum]